jgi:hypothetical protein
MVEDLCTRQYILMGYECQYFFYRDEPRWRLCDIPDPQESDPVVYAILASMVEALVEAFNWKLRLGIRRNRKNDYSEQRATNCKLETAPAWTVRVAPSEKLVDLNTHPDGAPEGEPHPVFRDRNILASMARLRDV